jgi:Villin headpiece domain
MMHVAGNEHGISCALLSCKPDGNLHNDCAGAPELGRETVKAARLEADSWTGAMAVALVGAPAETAFEARQRLDSQQSSSANAESATVAGRDGSSNPQEVHASSVHHTGDDGGGVACYPYSMLRAGADWPADVNPVQRDRHLTEDEFAAVFGMQRHAYDKLPAWKRLQLKQEKQLF